jgi:hypothetical protein
MLVFYTIVAILGFGSLVFTSWLETKQKLAAADLAQTLSKLRIAELEADQRKEGQA